MQKIVPFLIIASLTWQGTLWGQDESPQYPHLYSTSGFEMMFSFADMQKDENNLNTILRFAPVFNFQSMVNYDLSRNFGIFSGLAIRNVGLIYDDPDDPGVRKKHRTYNVGIPLGLKIGKMNGGLIYAGYEVELPFHYKEKTFRDEIKDKFTVWFSDRVQTIQHGFLVGVQFPYGANIKFKYYLSNFFNQNFRTSNGEYPYQNFEANIFYFSLNFALFKNLDLYYED